MPNSKIAEVIACEKCGCTFFETVEANRYAPISTIPDMAPNAIHRITMVVLRCLKCTNVVLPPAVISSTLSSIQHLYKELTNEIGVSPEELYKKQVGATKRLEVVESWNENLTLFKQ